MTMTRRKEMWHNFLIGFDSTDHFDFICPDCLRIANIVRCTKDGGTYGMVYFQLECPQCHKQGARKIYLFKDKIAKFEGPESAYAHENFILATYGIRKEG